jgi:hypothetical protein
MRSKLLVLLTLCFCISLALAEPWPIHVQRRDGPSSASSTLATEVAQSSSSSPTKSEGSNSASSAAASTTSHSGAASTTVPTSSSAAPTTLASTSSSHSATYTMPLISAVTSNMNGPVPTPSVNNDSTFNCTENPAVSGVFLLTLIQRRLPLESYPLHPKSPLGSPLRGWS